MELKYQVVKVKPEGSRGSLDSSITVFLALSFILIAALILTIAESARTVSERLYMQVALNSGMESLFSQFHRPLWENYRIFGLELRDDGDLAKELKSFMEPYLESKDLFPAKMSEEDISFSGHSWLDEDVNFEEEILEYMKYGMIDSIIRFAGKGVDEASISTDLYDIYKKAAESPDIASLQDQYRLDSADLQEMERALAAVSEHSKSLKKSYDEAAEALKKQEINDYFHASSYVRYWCEYLDIDADAYEKAAERLSEKVSKLREDFESRREGISDEGVQIIDSEIKAYEDYVSKTGSTWNKIDEVRQGAKVLKERAEGLEKDVVDFIEWINDLIEEAKESEEGYDFTAAVDEFFEAAYNMWMGFSVPEYEGEVSKINEESKGALDNIREMLTGDLLKLVLPEGVEEPSKAELYQDLGSLQYSADSTANPVQIVLMGEYAFKYFHRYHKEDNKETVPPSGSRQLEMEYLFEGGKSDYDNLSSIVIKLITLREVLNLLYLYSDNEKRTEVEAFVTSVLLIAANPLLIKIFTFFVIGIWALGQAIVDVRNLLSDKRIPLFHDRDSWSLTLEGLVSMGKEWGMSHLSSGGGSSNGNSGSAGEGGSTGGASADSDGGRGLSYGDYLRAFLFGAGLFDQGAVNKRMLARIEQNLRGSNSSDTDDNSTNSKTKGSFDIRHILYAVHASCEINAKHIMFEQGIVRSVVGHNLDPLYKFTVESYYKYKNETQ